MRPPDRADYRRTARGRATSRSEIASERTRAVAIGLVARRERFDARNDVSYPLPWHAAGMGSSIAEERAAPERTSGIDPASALCVEQGAGSFIPATTTPERVQPIIGKGESPAA